MALSYVFFYWYRVYIEDPKYSEAGEPTACAGGRRGLIDQAIH